MAVALQAELPPLETDAAGILRVGGTRVPFDAVIAAWDDGASAEEIAALYPVLDLADVYDTIAYYLHHRSSMDAYLTEQAQARAKVRTDAAERFDTSGLRERLLARRASQSAS